MGFFSQRAVLFGAGCSWLIPRFFAAGPFFALRGAARGASFCSDPLIQINSGIFYSHLIRHYFLLFFPVGAALRAAARGRLGAALSPTATK